MNWKLTVGVTLVVAVVIAVGILYLDKDIAFYCAAHFTDTRQFFRLVTKIGYGTPYLIGLPILFAYFKWIKGNRSLAEKMLFIFTSIAVSGILNGLLKFVFGRYRPYKMLAESLYGFTFFAVDAAATSFPSGHANLITALALSLSLVFPRLKYLWLSIALPVIMSRVVVGVHFFSDVVFGAYLACMTTGLVYHVFEQKRLLPARS